MASKKHAKLDQETGKPTFPYLRKGAGLRSRKGQNCDSTVQDCSKRKANFSPKKDEPTKKPLLDMTNDARKGNVLGNKENLVNQPKVNASNKDGIENVMPKLMVLIPRITKPVAAQPKPPKATKYVPHPRARLTQPYISKSAPESASKKKDSQTCASAPHSAADVKTERSSSLDTSKSEENLLYVTALEDCTTDTVSEKTTANASDLESFSSCDASTVIQVSCKREETKSLVPPNVEDFDATNNNDPFEAPCYAMDIFNYLKSREVLFPIDGSYLERQKGLSVWMRALLVDWMVETQEAFELNHETLYLAVKIVDLFLSRHKSLILKEHLQLVGTTALFISSKFDERVPPTLEDFTYLCDEAYTKSELVKMEITILKVLDYQLGLPLSYRFLRRYARSTRSPVEVLYLARYILEMSLMEYSLISRSDSKMAAAALLLARIMKDMDEVWNLSLVHYTGYEVSDIKDLVNELNAMIHKAPRDGLMAVRNKYSHSLFHAAAKVPLKENLQL